MLTDDQPAVDPDTGDGHPVDLEHSDLAPVLEQLIGPGLADLARRLDSIAQLSDAERQAVSEGTAAALRQEVWRKVSRVLVLELNAARVTGQLTAATPRERWHEWLTTATTPGFWDSLTGRYPTMVSRLRRMIDHRCAAAARMAERFVADRDAVAELSGATPRLVRLTPGEGDSHQGGETVMTLELVDGRVHYKPRPLEVDHELGRLLNRLLADQPYSTRLRVPRVVCRDGYGWAEHIAHRYCAGDDELRAFYYGIGQWLALMRLLSASDLHAGNVIAAGPVPVVVDCETLFTPQDPPPASGFGAAADRATQLVNNSVLRTGLLPVRGQSLALRGADISATGHLPGQQPRLRVPTMVGIGTDEAHLDFTTVPVPPAANHPAATPALDRHWTDVLDGFGALTDRLQELDRSGELEQLLTPFRDCQIRVVTRDTVVYVELARMLWHPVSLHREARARRRAIDVLIKQGRAAPLASVDPVVIDAEVTELLTGDIPVFTTVARDGRLTGPHGVSTGQARDLVDTALRRWRALDPAVDRVVTRSAVVSAYLNDSGPQGTLDEHGRQDQHHLLPSDHVVSDPDDPRRRTAAAQVMRRLIDGALRAEDRTVSWVALVLDATGWRIRPLSADLYSGVAGVAVALAAYRAESLAGRADPVPEVEPLLEDAVRTLRTYEEQTAQQRASAETAVRPEPPGAYVGLASRIWSWLLLREFGGVDVDEALGHAQALAELIPESVAVDDTYDVLYGMAGAVVPLLGLADLTGKDRWRWEAEQIGERLAAQARHSEHGARWPSERAPDGLGGFAHGVSGIGWALDRLAVATGQARFAELADAALRYEESLYTPDLGGWRDLRKPREVSQWWCHGAAGIGIMAADLWRHHGGQRWHDALRRAAGLCWRTGFGLTHTVCHGDLGSWELMSSALAAGAGPDGVERATLDGLVLSSLTEHGPRCHATVDVFVPGLMHGLSGVAYQLLRMHPDSRLPSLLLPDPGRGHA